jgi:hypothetical protein
MKHANLFEHLITQLFLVVLPFTVVTLLILLLCNGGFSYSLDDPYIHLALARNIWQGCYGINYCEVAAPASSILWPFLLAPFSVFPSVYEYVPLLFNLIFLGALTYLLDCLFQQEMLRVRRTIICIILLCSNAYGVVFTGMEHSLQILLVALILFELLKNYGVDKPKYAWYLFAALIILPTIRYEGLALSLPCLLYLFFKDEKQRSLIALALIFLCVGIFSFYLYAHGLGFLPSSVMAKSAHGIVSTLVNLYKNTELYGFLLIPVAAIVISQWRIDKAFCLLVILLTCFHFVFGRYGWLGRYECYYVIFVLISSIWFLYRYQFKPFPYVLVLPLAFISLLIPLLQTPLSASNIHFQQRIMADIARKLNNAVAVNDLGYVALDSGQYVLDLWGLGSIEALNARTAANNKNWINELMQKKNVHYAFIYENWFDDIPPAWVKVGLLKRNRKLTASFDATSKFSEVALYAADAESAAILRNTLSDYAKSINSDPYALKIIAGAL